MSHHRDNGRQPIVDNGAKLGDHKKVRRDIGVQMKMDMQAYIDAYPNKALMLINDLDGDVQRWLDAGAEPIPAKITGRKVYEGLNDKSANQWVRFAAGQTEGGDTYYAFGLMMDKDLYDQYKHEPERKRLEDIDNALFKGKVTEDSLIGGGSIHSYAASLPVGSGKGYNQIKSN